MMATIDHANETLPPPSGGNQPACDRLAEQACVVSQDIQAMGGIARDAARESLGELEEHASAVYEQGRDQVRDVTRKLERYVVERPIASVLIAAGVGLFLGRFWMRR